MRSSIRVAVLGSLALGVFAGIATGVSVAADAPPADRTVCTGRAPGGYDPDPSTTGVLPGSTLKVHRGNLVIKAPGTYANLDVHGFVDVRAADVKILNSIVRGGVATTSTGLITATDKNVARLHVEGVELVPESPSLWLTGILGHDYTAKCVNVYQTVDGFGVFNTHKPGAPTNVTITQSFCHALAYYSPDSGHADNKTHNDCVQLQGGSGTVITYNRLHAYLSNKVGTLNYPADHPQALSTIMLNDNVGKTTQIVVTDNLLTGGDISVNGGGLQHDSDDFLGTFHRNRFDHGQFHVGHTIDLDATVRADTGDGTANRNIYTDSSPITVRHNG
jgi:hypothetical protein